MADLSFVYFDNDNDLRKFLIKNYDDIIDSLIKCFAPEDEFEKIKKDRLFDYMIMYKFGDWFFVLSDNKVIAFCILISSDIYNKYEYDIETYKVFKSSKYPKPNLGTSIKTGPFIETLCKKSGFKDAGKFLLDNLHALLKQRGITNVYLVPESMRNKDAYNGYLKHDNCNLSSNYYSSNMRLIEFYKKMGYHILDKSYVIDTCEDNKDIRIAYNVMMIDLK